MRRLVMIIAVLLVCAGTAAADIIILKNGNRMEGEIVSRDETGVTVRINRAEIRINHDRIEEIIVQKTPRELYMGMLEALEDDDALGHYHVALYCSKENLTDEAIELLRHALHLDPNLQEARQKLTAILNPLAKELIGRAERAARAGDVQRALDSYLNVQRNMPESDYAPQAMSAIADIHFDQQNYTAAMEQWKRVLEHDRKNTRAYLGVIRICELIGEFERALHLIDGVLQYEQDAKVRALCHEKHEAISAIIAAIAAIEQNPADPVNYEAAAFQFRRLGHDRMMIRWLEKAAGRGSKNLDTMTTLARHYDSEYRPIPAQASWERVLELEPGAAIEREATERLEALGVWVLIPEYLTTAGPRRRAEILEKLNEADLAIETAEKIVRNCIEYSEPEKRGMVTHGSQTSDGKEFAYILFIPENYDSSIRWPLIVALHAAGGSGDNYIFTWAQHAQKHGYLVLAPTADAATGWRGAGRDYVLTALDEVTRNFNIDRNRVFLDGVSMGAGAAWELAVSRPDRFGALISRSGGADSLVRIRIDNAAQMPVYIIHGLNDTVAPVDGIRQMRTSLIRAGGQVEFRIDNRSGHSAFAGETEKIIEWLAGCRRNPKPTNMSFLLYNFDRPRNFWLKAEVLTDTVFNPDVEIGVPKIGDEHLSGEMLQNYYMSTARAGLARMEGRINDNTIHLETRHIVGCTVFLNDSLIDLSQPVEIYVNKRKTYSGMVRKSLPFMLEFARREYDPDMIFSAHVRVVVEQ